MVVDTYHVPALDAPIEILIDEWGIPHIYAQSPRDAYLAQGFAAARDRLWQMDLWRKRGLGRLAENFGPAYAEADRARRMFLYRGDMATEWAAYGPGVSEIAVAFVEGINAYVDVIERGDASLPPEFGWTDSRPVRWKPEDIVSIRSVGLRSNVQDELARVRLEALGHSYLDHARRRRSPPRDINSPSGYDPRAISSDALALYLRALAEPSFSERSVQPAADQTMATASNVWALAPNRTTTGRPLLANDPHRLHSMPSLRWLVHLDAPGLSAIGATEPVHPGISSGHNGAMAFGYTYSACDQEDLFIHSLRDGRFRTEGGWQDFDVVEEVVAVRDEDCQRFTLKYAGKNPVLFEDEQAGYCVILKSAFLEPGGAPYFAGVNYHQSTDLADFNERLSYAGAPTMNYVGADTDGNIGAFVRGFVPKRDGWDGGTPAFGDDGIASWQGFCAHDALPTERDPACGWVGNCNQVPLPGNFDHDRLSLGQEFSDDVRFRRLADLIETKTRHSLADVADYQCDQRLAYAPEMMASLLASSPTLPPLFTAQLSAWEGDISIGSAEAAFFIVWLERHLRPAVLLERVPATVRNAFPAFDLNLVRSPLPAEGVLRDTGYAAFVELSDRLGTDWTKWTLGALQTIKINHPLADRASEQDKTNVGPAPIGGHVQTLNKASSDDALSVSVGPSFRLVIDVGEWDNSVAVNMPGQSGDPSSAHYADQFEFWRTGQYIPLISSRHAVEESCRSRIVLTPIA